MEIRLPEGAEQKLYFDFTLVDTSGIKPCPEPTSEPTAEPTTEPTAEPTGGTGGGDEKPGLPATGAPLPLLGGAGVWLVATTSTSALRPSSRMRDSPILAFSLGSPMVASSRPIRDLPPRPSIVK